MSPRAQNAPCTESCLHYSGHVIRIALDWRQPLLCQSLHFFCGLLCSDEDYLKSRYLSTGICQQACHISCTLPTVMHQVTEGPAHTMNHSCFSVCFSASVDEPTTDFRQSAWRMRKHLTPTQNRTSWLHYMSLLSSYHHTASETNILTYIHVATIF